MTVIEKKESSVVIDARGPRFSAAITVFVLATVELKNKPILDILVKYLDNNPTNS
jgi:hypothetical protein